ncbi:MAG: protein kinase [Gammaproteobacteria bacterium]|nr:protein kinase [Gammaproteobacteria bacterium]
MSKGVLEMLENQDDLTAIKQIGQGDFSSVYKVKKKDSQGKSNQVVRVIHEISDHQSLKREKDLLNYLNQYSEFAHFNEMRKVGFYYLQFFDYKGKRNLKQQITKKGTLSANKVRKLLSNMISILEKVHALGFIHGDIKPTNIVVGKQQFFLIDWTQAIPSLSSYDTEMLTGDKRNTPPERLNGQLEDKGDIYALGCTLYYALTGKHIYRLDKVEKTAKQLWATVHHSPYKLNKLPIFWRYLIIWMTQKDPKKRPDLLALKAWLEDVTVPDWVRKTSLKVDKSFPHDAMAQLADEHYMYPIFKQALQYEKSGDLQMAFNLYENCAFRGYSRAENNIGLMYEQGEPVQQSFAMAANMYHHAFKKGNPFAAYNLARLFQTGSGMEINVEQAFKLYKFSALRGNLKAQNALGIMYQQGEGTAVNLAQAKFWFEMAAIYGNKQAKKNLKALTESG